MHHRVVEIARERQRPEGGARGVDRGGIGRRRGGGTVDAEARGALLAVDLDGEGADSGSCRRRCVRSTGGSAMPLASFGRADLAAISSAIFFVSSASFAAGSACRPGATAARACRARPRRWCRRSRRGRGAPCACRPGASGRRCRAARRAAAARAATPRSSRRRPAGSGRRRAPARSRRRRRCR